MVAGLVVAGVVGGAGGSVLVVVEVVVVDLVVVDVVVVDVIVVDVGVVVEGVVVDDGGGVPAAAPTAPAAVVVVVVGVAGLGPVVVVAGRSGGRPSVVWSASQSWSSAGEPLWPASWWPGRLLSWPAFGAIGQGSLAGGEAVWAGLARCAVTVTAAVAARRGVPRRSQGVDWRV